LRSIWMLTPTIFACCPLGFAIYGPSLVRAAPDISLRACQEADFTNGHAIIQAMQKGTPSAIAGVVPDALEQLSRTPTDAPAYPARAFCIHELIPSSLPAATETGTTHTPTAEVNHFGSLGLPYFYYDPDARWVLRQNPVDLNQLATKYLNSKWGRQAFSMMTGLGWSRGGCQEGPNQFREVILRGRQFLRDYPDSEVADDIRLAVANAYATWWNLSRDRARANAASANPYIKGAEEAKEQAVRLYSSYLVSPKVTDQNSIRDVRQRLASLRSNPKGSGTYEYFCQDYED
jgi:hypothetical protein